MKNLSLKSILIVLIGLICHNCFSQDLEWAKKLGGTNAEIGFAISEDTFGNIITTGRFNGTVDFDPGVGTFNLTSSGLSDIFVSKLDRNGDFLWAVKMGGLNNEQGRNLVIDDFGNIYITGFFIGTADFDPGIGTNTLTSAGSQDAYICKLDSLGNFLWVRQFRSTGEVYGHEITIDNAGNILITGYFNGTVDFDPGILTSNLTTSGSFDVFVVKLSNLGNLIWAKKFGGNSDDRSAGVDVDESGNVYTTGFFGGTADFNTGTSSFNLSSSGGLDIFISKLDSLGDFIWARKLGGSSNDRGASIYLDEDKNVYTTGIFRGTVDFNPGTTTFNLSSSGNDDAFISKLDSTGNFIYANKIGGTAQDVASKIKGDIYGNIYLAGYFNGTTDFDPSSSSFNLTSNGGSDIFISKYNSSGNLEWATSFGSTGNDLARSIYIDKLTNIYTSGEFRGSVDFDPGLATFNLSSSGFEDIFVQKMSQCPQRTASLSISACNSYLSPSGNRIWTSSGLYNDTISDPSGCDSTIAINLTINNVNTSVTNNSPILFSNAVGASYQWVDCNNGYSIITGATNQSYLATANGDYAVIITENGCSDTSICLNVNTVSLQELVRESKLRFYPNPMKEKLIIELGAEYSDIVIRVRNTIGQEVFTQNYLNTNKVELNIDANPGLYLIELTADSERFKVFKVFKN
mgnify:FL=1